MPISLKIVAVAFTLAASMGVAPAAEPELSAPDRNLHLAIALQGDQALLDIRNSMLASMQESIRAQMSVSLQVAADTSPTRQAQGFGANARVAAAADY